jgi:membrane fusion protein (multidrug efflux system)
MPDSSRPTGSDRIRLPAALLLWSILIAGCTDPTAVESARGAAGDDLTDVVTAIATIRPLALEIEAVGTALANESVEVTSKATNIVVAVRFEEGDLVRRGDVLVELDSAEARAELEEAEAALAESNNQFKRSRDLFAQQALSISQLDQIEAMLKGNRARVSAAKARVSDTVIRASFDGRTGFRRVSVGSLVNPGTIITTLDDTSIIKLDFTVAETYFYMLERGLRVSARSVGIPGREFVGTVSNIGSRVDPVTRSLTVRAEIPNKEGVLRPGMFMTVALEGEPEPTLLIPEAAIVPEQGKTFVFTVRDGIVERREVRTGKRRPGEVEIVEGLQANEHVVIEGTQNVRDGTRVNEQLRDEAPSS